MISSLDSFYKVWTIDPANRSLNSAVVGCACAPEQNGAPKVGNPQPTKGWADLTPQAHPT
jgi:hypothetical protein